MAKGRRLLVAVLGVCVALTTFSQTGVTAMAESNKTYLDTLNVGVATIIDPSAYGTADTEEKAAKTEAVDVSGNDMAVEEPVEEEPKSSLVMADVYNALNVRAEADEESEIVGKLYKDCGGTMGLEDIQKIDSKLLTDERKHYLEWHNNKFNETNK